MKKIQSNKSDFSPIKREGTSIILSYGYQEIEGNDATWYEVSLPKNHYPTLTFENVRDAILGDIDSQTDEKILTGYVWRIPKLGGEPEEVGVWLSSENQFNYKAAFDLAIQTNGQNLPVMFKFGITEEPVYHIFNELSELQDFYVGAVSFINQTLAEGWQRKDSIDWNDYLIPGAEGSV